MFAGRQPDWRHTGQDLWSRGRDWGIRKILLWRSHLQPRYISIDHGTGGTWLRRRWYLQRRLSARKWSHCSIGGLLLVAFFFCGCKQRPAESPQTTHDRIQRLVET